MQLVFHKAGSDPQIGGDAYLAGSGWEVGYGVVVGADGSAYVSGATSSTNFPTQNPFQTDQPGLDGFVTRVSPVGNSLYFSTYLGGNDEDRALRIALDDSGCAYVAGYTLSSNFPTVYPLQTDQGSTDAFVSKFSQTGNSLQFSTYLGGDGTDMGIGIALDTSARKMTWSGLSGTMGTPDYMAPEQIKGLRGDARTDIYSLGAILYEMLTAEVPFTGNNVHSAMRAKMQEDPTPPRRLRNEISPQLEEAVLHALERQPHDRFDSALELREALTHLDSVRVTGRAARQRSKPKLPPWMRALLTVVLGIAAYGLLMWIFSRISLRMPHERPDHGRSPASTEQPR